MNMTILSNFNREVGCISNAINYYLKQIVILGLPQSLTITTQPNILHYTADITASTITAIRIKPTGNYKTTIIKVNDAVVTSGGISAPINIASGIIIPIDIYSSVGVKLATYTIEIIK